MYALNLLVIVFCLLIILMAGWLAFSPRALTDYLLKHSGDRWLHFLAAAVRIVLGIALILIAGNSHFTLALQIIGWIAIVAGIVLALLPPARFQQLVQWAFERFGQYTRIAALAALAFGVFLIYAVL